MSLDERVRVLGAGEHPPRREAEKGRYVYCSIACDSPRWLGPIRIGGRDDGVSTIHPRGPAALVSGTPVVVHDPTRENALTHEHVNEAVRKEFTVIPMSFGIVSRAEKDVVEFLKGTRNALLDV